MEKIITGDGSETFRSEKFDEPYHTKSGAREEAFEKHAKPLLKDFHGDKIRILDFCFGLGYNTAAALDLLDCKVEVIALENDRNIINKILEIKPDFKSWKIIQEAAKNLTYEDEKIKFKIILDDALKVIKTLEGNFDIVFFDPFSPKKHPEMWTEEVFQRIFNLMNKGGKLTTYSCARSVRDNLKNVGFKVIDGPIIGRRSPATIAIKE